MPYVPSQQYRFEVSRDLFSLDRIDAVSKINIALRNHVPFYAGIVVFGSLSKGKYLNSHTADYSDIDIRAFIDADEVIEQYTSFADKDGIFNRELERQIEDYASFLNNMTARRTSYTRQQVLAQAPFIPLRVATDYTNQQVKLGITRLLQPFNRPEVFTETQLIGLKGDYSLLETIKGLQAMDPLDNNLQRIISQATKAIALPFGLDIDGGLTKYRKGLIDDMVELSPEDREEKWRLVNDCVQLWERFDDIPERARYFYPQTFEDAKAWYGGKAA